MGARLLLPFIIFVPTRTSDCHDVKYLERPEIFAISFLGHVPRENEVIRGRHPELEGLLISFHCICAANNYNDVKLNILIIEILLKVVIAMAIWRYV